MQPIYLFDLAARKTHWLAARETAIAGNVANANTPGYRAKDVASFTDVLAKTQLEMASTSAGHLPISGSVDFAGTPTAEDDNAVEITETGNTVGIEQEMMKAGAVNGEYAMATNVIKSFHSMLMSSLRGS